MESGEREDGVEKRVREMRTAELTALQAQEHRHNELLAARQKLKDTFLAHLGQTTTNEVVLLEMQDAPYSLQGVIFVDVKGKAWTRSVFVFGVDTYKDTDGGTDVTYFLNPTHPHDLAEPVGAERMLQIVGVSLGAVITSAVQVAIEIMARERYAGATLLTNAESIARDQREQSKKAQPAAPVKAKKGNGCAVALGWIFGLMVAGAIVDAFNG